MPTETEADERAGDSIRSVLTWPVLAAATVLAALAAGAVLWLAGGDDSPTSEPDVRLTDPDIAPGEERELGSPVDVEVLLLDGSTTTIRDQLDGRPVVVNFFQSYCAPCVREMPEFQEVASELSGTVDFIGLAVLDRPEDAADLVEQTGVTYPWFRDRDGDASTAANVTNMPTTLFVAADGSVVTARSGAIDKATLQSLIAESFPGVT